MKNKKMSVCIFPETVPGDAILFPLVQVFTPIVYCRAVEEDEIPVELQFPLSGNLKIQVSVKCTFLHPLVSSESGFLP